MIHVFMNTITVIKNQSIYASTLWQSENILLVFDRLVDCPQFIISVLVNLSQHILELRGFNEHVLLYVNFLYSYSYNKFECDVLVLDLDWKLFKSLPFYCILHIYIYESLCMFSISRQSCAIIVPFTYTDAISFHTISSFLEARSHIRLVLPILPLHS